jgi:hypothetical protein
MLYHNKTMGHGILNRMYAVNLAGAVVLTRAVSVSTQQDSDRSKAIDTKWKLVVSV